MVKRNNGEVPAKYKAISVRDLLTEEQVSKVLAIMKKEKNAAKRVKKVKKYLEQFHANLEIKGVVPGYLAYYFEYLKSQGTLDKV